MLRMLSVEVCSRNRNPDGTWRVVIDGRAALEGERWAISALTGTGLLMWADLETDGLQLAIVTTAGHHHLRAWDIEMFNAFLSDVHCSRSLSCLDDLQIEVAKRLIGEAFPHGNPTRERDER
jgi:hypothetical protein